MRRYNEREGSENDGGEARADKDSEDDNWESPMTERLCCVVGMERAKALRGRAKSSRLGGRPSGRGAPSCGQAQRRRETGDPLDVHVGGRAYWKNKVREDKGKERRLREGGGRGKEEVDMRGGGL